MPSLMPVYYILQRAHHQTTAGSDNETSGLPLRLVPKTAKLANIDNVDKPQCSIGLSSMSSTQANWIGSDEAGKGDYFGPLVVAADMKLTSVAFPSISTGAYGYPLVEASRIAISSVCSFLSGRASTINRVVFVLFDSKTYESYCSALQQMIETAD